MITYVTPRAAKWGGFETRPTVYASASVPGKPISDRPLFTDTVLGFGVEGEAAVVEAPLLQQRFNPRIFEGDKLSEETGHGVGRTEFVAAYPTAVAGYGIDETALVWTSDLYAGHVFTSLNNYALRLERGVGEIG